MFTCLVCFLRQQINLLQESSEIACLGLENQNRFNFSCRQDVGGCKEKNQVNKSD